MDEPSSYTLKAAFTKLITDLCQQDVFSNVSFIINGVLVIEFDNGSSLDFLVNEKVSLHPNIEDGCVAVLESLSRVESFKNSETVDLPVDIVEGRIETENNDILISPHDPSVVREQQKKENFEKPDEIPIIKVEIQETAGPHSCDEDILTSDAADVIIDETNYDVNVDNQDQKIKALNKTDIKCYKVHIPNDKKQNLSDNAESHSREEKSSNAIKNYEYLGFGSPNLVHRSYRRYPCIYNCTPCHKTFEHMQGYKIHRLGHSIGCCKDVHKQSSKTCRVWVDDVRPLQRLSDKMETEMPLVQPLQNGDNVRPLQRLPDKMETDMPHVCHICGVVNHDPVTFKIHMSTHKARHTYNCDKCNKSYRQLPSIKRHMSRHANPFKCDKCSASFLYKKKFQRHYTDKHTEKKNKYLCPLCGFISASRTSLCSHKRIMHRDRTKDDSFKCNMCPKTFPFLRWLNNHIRNVHTADSEKIWFPCDKCPKTFSSKPNLKTHMYTHLTETPFKCDMCDKSFKSKRHLREHKKKIHQGFKREKVKCEICLENFAHSASLKRHKLRKHSRQVL